MAILALTISACHSKGADGAESSVPNLLFASGFEGDVSIDTAPVVNFEDYRYIRGRDSQTGFRWPIAILGSTQSALHYIADDNHRAVDAEIQTVMGHNGAATRALYQEENYACREDTQLPYEILNIADGKSNLYIRYWIKLDRESLTQPDKWRTFFEWKSKGYADGNGFRLIAFIYTDSNGNPYWHWQGDAGPESPIWEIDNTDVAVPVGEWFLTEFYWRWSEGDDGRALWRVNGQVIGDHYGPTTRSSQPVDFIMLFQIYGDANPKYQWIDDVEIWDGLPVP